MCDLDKSTKLIHRYTYEYKSTEMYLINTLTKKYNYARIDCVFIVASHSTNNNNLYLHKRKWSNVVPLSPNLDNNKNMMLLYTYAHI